MLAPLYTTRWALPQELCKESCQHTGTGSFEVGDGHTGSDRSKLDFDLRTRIERKMDELDGLGRSVTANVFQQQLASDPTADDLFDAT